MRILFFTCTHSVICLSDGFACLNKAHEIFVVITQPNSEHILFVFILEPNSEQQTTTRDAYMQVRSKQEESPFDPGFNLAF